MFLSLHLARVPEPLNCFFSKHRTLGHAQVLLPFFPADGTFPKDLEELTLQYLEDGEVRVRFVKQLSQYTFPIWMPLVPSITQRGLGAST